jgi:ABC-type Fe3+ transport system substrate-binding protein
MLAMAAARAAELPKATQELLKRAKFDDTILAGLDAELAMPSDWLDRARGEGELRIVASWDPRQFRDFTAPFRERFPFVKLNYTRGSVFDRGVKILAAYSQGRSLADIVSSSSGTWLDFKDAGALVDLRILPNFALLLEENRDPDGLWIGERTAYRCMAYNTQKFRTQDLPRTWDDLVTNPIWRNGVIGIPDLPSLWLTQLWDAKGPAWTTDFMTRFFTVVKPQLRKEGTNAMVGLTAAGELPAMIGAADYRVKEMAARGAPVNWHCPAPVPVAVSQLLMLKGGPAPYSGYLFLNWFLSREGQVAQFAADSSIPVHRDLALDRRFLPFPDEVIGKELMARDEAGMRTEFPKLLQVYEPLWKAAGGPEVKPREE